MTEIPFSTVKSWIDDLNAAYEGALRPLPMTSKNKEMLVSGARDGHRNGVYAVLKTLGYEVVDG